MCTRRSMIVVLAVLLMAVGSVAVAQDESDLIDRFRVAQGALNAHDLDQWVALLADDAIYDFAGLPTPMTTKGEMRAFFEAVFQGFPDYLATEVRVLAGANIVVAEQVGTGTHLGVWNGIPPTGNPVRFALVDVVQFDGGKITRAATYTDMAGVMMQLGVMPPSQMPELVPSFPIPDPEPTGLSPVQAAQEAQARWNRQDLAADTKMQSADNDIFFAPVAIPINRTQYAAMQELYFQAFPDLQVSPAGFVDLGYGWVLCECTWAGTHGGPYFGIPATGTPVQVRGAILYQFDAQGLEKAIHCYYDNLTILNQIMPKCPPSPAIPDCYIQDEITSPSLEGNPLGDPATRPLLVYLPGSYSTSPEKRYPTIYLLHGFLGDHTYFTSAGVYNVFAKAMAGLDLGTDVDSVVQELTTSGRMGEAIIVMPNAINLFGGSFYERSPLIGDYRSYIARDLVAYVDAKYRTIADRHHRGIAGHSMGGYGAISLALEYPDVFGAVAALSPWGCDLEVQPTMVERALAEFPLVQGLPTVVSTRDDLWNIVLTRRETNPVYAAAAAWTPNFNKPPFYADLPMQYPEKSIVPEIWDQWLEHDLVSQIERDGKRLSETPVFVDEGRGVAMIYKDMVGIQNLLRALYDQEISYTYDAFDGDHFTHMRYQLASALEFLCRHIASE